MKKLHRILLAAAGGALILATMWPEIKHVIYFTDPFRTGMGVPLILPAAVGLLLLGYAARQIHPALEPLGWSALFWGNLARVLVGKSDGFVVDVAMTIMLGIPGVLLVIKGIGMYLRDRRQIEKAA